MPAEERGLTSGTAQKGGRAWPLARAYQGHTVFGNSRLCHMRRHDPVGKPDAGNPHVRFDERGTGNAARGAGLRPGAKATDMPPDPKAGAPAPDSTT